MGASLKPRRLPVTPIAGMDEPGLGQREWSAYLDETAFQYVPRPADRRFSLLSELWHNHLERFKLSERRGVYAPGEPGEVADLLFPLLSRSGEPHEYSLEGALVEGMFDADRWGWLTEKLGPTIPAGIEIDAIADFRPRVATTYRARVRSVREAEPELALSELEWQGLGLVDDDDK